MINKNFCDTSTILLLPAFFLYFNRQAGSWIYASFLLFEVLLLFFRSLFLTARPLLRDWPIARHLCHTRRAEGKRRGTDGSSIGNDPQLREPSFVQARLCSIARNIVSLFFTFSSLFPYARFFLLFFTFYSFFHFYFFLFFAHIHDNFLFSSLLNYDFYLTTLSLPPSHSFSPASLQYEWSYGLLITKTIATITYSVSTLVTTTKRWRWWWHRWWSDGIGGGSGGSGDGDSEWWWWRRWWW